jgi:hypothetical protein
VEALFVLWISCVVLALVHAIRSLRAPLPDPATGVRPAEKAGLVEDGNPFPKTEARSAIVAS